MSAASVPTVFADTVRVEPMADALANWLAAHGGHDARSEYVETFWLPVLGPTATFLLRRLASWLQVEPGGFDLNVVDSSALLGVGHKGGKNSPFARALHRLGLFGVARWARVGGERPPLYQVRTALPALTATRLSRLPQSLQRSHAAAVDGFDRRYRLSPTCRFAKDARERPSALAHVCTDKFGGPVRPGTECHAEASAQIRDAGEVGLLLDGFERALAEPGGQPA